MADERSAQEVSTSTVTGESSDSSVELNVKTLDAQIYTFRVEKNMPVPLFKEKIAGTIGVPVEQQRLIFRGKVLKDNQCLSEYRDAHNSNLFGDRGSAVFALTTTVKCHLLLVLSEDVSSIAGLQ